MKRKIFSCQIVLMFFIFVCLTNVYAGTWETIVVGEQSLAEELATVDLQRYIGEVTGNVPKVMTADKWSHNPVPAVILGSKGTNGILNKYPFEVSRLSGDGFCLINAEIDSVNVIIASGVSSAGNVNAIYGLLRECGFGFYLGYESVPLSLPLKLAESPIFRNSVFKIRGVLPWSNFLNCPTTWDLVDYRSFFDQLIRSGANMVTFHSYDFEPYGAYFVDGKSKQGNAHLTTADEVWGTKKTKTTEFVCGTDKLFDGEYFGAESSFIGGDKGEVVLGQQKIFRSALDYAKKRGIKSCLGIDASDDPTEPLIRDEFINKINYLLDFYPQIEYLGVWRPEWYGPSGYPNRGIKVRAESFLYKYVPFCRDIYSRVVNLQLGVDYPGSWAEFIIGEEGKNLRAMEAARFEQYAMLAYRQIARRKDGPKLVLSGWGGEDYLLAGEYFEGLDRTMPKDVIFSALDNINTNGVIDRIYGELPADRERWVVPWLENDGDLWQPQPHVSDYSKIVSAAHKSGCQGISSIHWRTREPGQAYSYLLNYAWDPSVTVESFFAEYIKREYPTEAAAEILDIYKTLEGMGYRWVGGYGQAECKEMMLSPGEKGKAELLASLKERAEKLLPKADKGTELLTWTINRMQWVLDYYNFETAAKEVEILLVKIDETDDAQEKNKLAQKCEVLLDGSLVSKMLHCYTQRISTRGEYGVMASINAKAVRDWQDKQNKVAKILGKEPTQFETQWDIKPTIILPRFISSIEKGKDFIIKPIVLGGGDAWMYYRVIGSKTWKQTKLKTLRGWVQSGMIKADAIKGAGMEVGFSFSDRIEDEMAYGPIAITIMPELKIEKTIKAYCSNINHPELRLEAKAYENTGVMLSWNDLFAEADYFRVYRDGKLIAETAVSYCPDELNPQKVRYYVEAINKGDVIGKSNVFEFTSDGN